MFLVMGRKLPRGILQVLDDVVKGPVPFRVAVPALCENPPSMCISAL
jgi:hypothetical protein